MPHVFLQIGMYCYISAGLKEGVIVYLWWLSRMASRGVWCHVCRLDMSIIIERERTLCGLSLGMSSGGVWMVSGNVWGCLDGVWGCLDGVKMVSQAVCDVSIQNTVVKNYRRL